MNKLLGVIFNRKFNFSFKSLLVISSILLSLIYLLVIAVHSYYSTVKFISDKTESANISNLYQANYKLDTRLTQIRKTVDFIKNNDDLLDKVKSYNKDTYYNKRVVKTDIVSFLNKSKIFNQYIYDIYLFTETGVFNVIPSEAVHNITNDEIKDFILNQYPEDKYNSSALLYEGNYNDKNMDQQLKSLLGKLSFICTLQDNLGTLIVVINKNIFGGLSNNPVVIKNNEGRNIWPSSFSELPDMNGLYKGSLKLSNKIKKTTFNNKDIYFTESAYNNWHILYFENSAHFSRTINLLNLYLIITFVFITLLLAIFSGAVSKKLSRPVSSLVLIVKSYFNGKKLPEEYSFEKVNNRLSLREKILYKMILLAFIPTVLYSGISYYYTSGVIKDTIREENISSMENLAENIDLYLADKLKVMKLISHNTIVQNMFSENNGQDFTNDLEVYTSIEQMMRLGQNYNNLLLYDKNGSLLFTNNHMLYHSSLETNIHAFLENRHPHYTIIDTQNDIYNRAVINLLMKINDVEDYYNLGYLECHIMEEEFEQIYKNTIRDGIEVFIVNDNNYIISHPDKNKIGNHFLGPDAAKSIKNNDIMINYTDSYMHTAFKLSNTSWYLVGQFYNNKFRVEQMNSLFTKVFLLLIMFLIIVFISYQFSYNITSSLTKMGKMLKKIGVDNMDIHFPQDTHIFEINELGKAFNEMAIRIETLIDQLFIETKNRVDIQNKKEYMEMISLQAQVNPHFLYNTFESIISLVDSGDKPNSIKMVSALCELLRFSSKSNQPVVRISEELDHAMNYCKIMKMRYADKLFFEWEIDKSTLQYKINRLITQPLIENAIYHGIIPKQTSGSILISCKKNNNCILITVSDDGVGMSSQSLKDLVRNLECDSDYEKIGLFNANNRIKLTFGKQYGISISSGPEKGTCVTLTIPMQL